MTTVTRTSSTTPSPAPAAPGVPMDDDSRLDAAIETIGRTNAGRELAVLLRERRDDIVIVDEGDSHLPEGAGGRWDPVSQQLYVLRSQLDELGFETLLAHEAEHMRDGGGWGRTAVNALGGVAQGLLGMFTAPLQLRNPISAAVDGIRSGYQISGEVDAYHVQAQVAQELGLHADFLQHADHAARSRDELEQWLLEEPLYQFPPAMRTALGAGFAYGGGRATGQVANVLLRRFAPESWAAGHSGVVTAASLTLWAGLLVQDHLAARAATQ